MTILYLPAGGHVHKVLQGVYLAMELLGYIILFCISIPRNTGNILAFFNKVSLTHLDFYLVQGMKLNHLTKDPFLG